MGIFDRFLGKKDRTGQYVDESLEIKKSVPRKKGVLDDTAHMSIGTTATMLGYLAKTCPEEIILYHAKDKTVLEKFVKIASPLGYKINEFTSENISTSFIKGINIFTTPILLEFIIKGKMEKLEKPFIFTDDFQAAKNATGWSCIKDPLSIINGIHPDKQNLMNPDKKYENVIQKNELKSEPINNKKILAEKMDLIKRIKKISELINDNAVKSKIITDNESEGKKLSKNDIEQIEWTYSRKPLSGQFNV